MSKIIKKKDTQEINAFFSQERFIEARTDDKQRRELLKKITLKAEKEAEQIINDAKKQIIAEQQAGFEEGLRRGLEKVQSLEPLLKGLLEEIKNYRDNYESDLEPQLIKLVMNVCNKILKDKLESDRELIVRTVQDAFREITDKEFIKIRVHHSDLELMREFQPKLLETFHEIKDFEVVPDESVGKGGCILETNEGSVDATMKTQMQKIFDAMKCETAVAGMRVK